MGELIKADFGNRRIDRDEKKLPKQREDTDSCFLSSDPKEVLGIIDKINRLPISQSVLNEKSEIVSGYSQEELTRWLVNSTEKDWSTKPSFFRAVANQFLSKIHQSEK
ncbi:MAG: hypothetical protein KAQ63_02330 [Candidatus Moranbacteria bacterium]|nr:hypothetical protein [Candidatus Moranbacteria bacterium]